MCVSVAVHVCSEINLEGFFLVPLTLLLLLVLCMYVCACGCCVCVFRNKPGRLLLGTLGIIVFAGYMYVCVCMGVCVRVCVQK